MASEISPISLTRLLVLIAAEVHGHGTAADRTFGNHIGRNAAVPAGLIHLAEHGAGVVDPVMAALRALDMEIIALGAENLLLGQACFFKLTVRVGGKTEQFFTRKSRRYL